MALRQHLLDYYFFGHGLLGIGFQQHEIVIVNFELILNFILFFGVDDIGFNLKEIEMDSHFFEFSMEGIALVMGRELLVYFFNVGDGQFDTFYWSETPNDPHQVISAFFLYLAPDQIGNDVLKLLNLQIGHYYIPAWFYYVDESLHRSAAYLCIEFVLHCLDEVPADVLDLEDDGVGEEFGEDVEELEKSEQ